MSNKPIIVVKNNVSKRESVNKIGLISQKDILDELDELDELDKLDKSNKGKKSASLEVTIKPNNEKRGLRNSIELMKKSTDINEKIKVQIMDDKNDIYDNLDEQLPKNYGNKWSEEDKIVLIDMLKKSGNKEIDYISIGQKLGRSEGGVKGEVKKMITRRYLNGEDAELIALDLNIQYKFVKIIIKSYIDNEIICEIENLEKENKFLKLKMENIELRKKINKMTSTKE